MLLFNNVVLIVKYKA